MFGFKDKSQDCYRYCVNVTNLTLTKEMGFDLMRAMTQDEKTTIMGVLVYYIAGIINANTARKVIEYYSSQFTGSKKFEVENNIQEIYQNTRMTSERIMGHSSQPLYEIVDENISMLMFISGWDENENLRETLQRELLNFYVKVKSL